MHIYTVSLFQHLIRRLLITHLIRWKTEISNPKCANESNACPPIYSNIHSCTHAGKNTFIHRHSSEKCPHQKNTSLSLGNPTTFKQINMCLCYHKHSQKCSSTPAHAHTHTDTHASSSSWVEKYTTHCNSHPVWAKPKSLPGGETPVSSIAPNYGGLQAESTPTFLYNHIVWEEISSLFAYALAVGKGFRKSHLNDHILKESKNVWTFLWKRNLNNFAEASSTLFFFVQYACCDQTDTLIPRTQ